MGYYLDELEVGRVFRYAIRPTVTETDNLLFSTMTHNPRAAAYRSRVHANSRNSAGRSSIASSLGLIVGLSIHETTLGTTVANLGLEEARFPAPLFVGDTVHVETQVIASRPSRSRPTQGIVTLEHRGFNQDDVLIATCRRNVLMLRAPAAASVAKAPRAGPRLRRKRPSPR